MSMERKDGEGWGWRRRMRMGRDRVSGGWSGVEKEDSE